MTLVADFFGILLLVVLCVLVILTFVFLQVVRDEKKSFSTLNKLDPNHNTIVMVLGATAWPEGPCPELQSRLNLALALEKAVKPQHFFVFGGIDLVDEAESMRNYLLDAGIPAERIIADSRGSNTRMSCKLFAEYLLDLPQAQLVAVSSGYHASRLRIESKKYGLNVAPASQFDSPELLHTHIHRVRLWSEVLAILWYALPAGVTKFVNTGPTTFRHRVPEIFLRAGKKKTNTLKSSIS